MKSYHPSDLPSFFQMFVNFRLNSVCCAKPCFECAVCSVCVCVHRAHSLQKCSCLLFVLLLFAFHSRMRKRDCISFRMHTTFFLLSSSSFQYYDSFFQLIFASLLLLLPLLLYVSVCINNCISIKISNLFSSKSEKNFRSAFRFFHDTENKDLQSNSVHILDECSSFRHFLFSYYQFLPRVGVFILHSLAYYSVDKWCRYSFLAVHIGNMIENGKNSSHSNYIFQASFNVEWKNFNGRKKKKIAQPKLLSYMRNARTREANLHIKVHRYKSNVVCTFSIKRNKNNNNTTTNARKQK